jgi:signal transduction histidine kinase/HPt (histidine-containing phosphotransfer) domain-containing protein/ActR/RegA family two-component response regulator
MEPTRPPPSGKRLAGGPMGPLYICALALIAILIAAEATILSNLRDSTLRTAEGNLRNISLALAEQASRSLQDLDLVLTSVVENLAAQGVVDGATLRGTMAGPETQRLLKDRVTGLPFIDAVTLIDPDGNLVNFSRTWPIPAVNVTDRDYFRAMRADLGLHSFISEPVQNRGDGAWNVYLARRIPSADGSFAGLVLGAIKLQYFEDLYRSVSLSDDSTIALLRDDAILLARFPPLPTVGVAYSPVGGKGFSGKIGNAVFRAPGIVNGGMRLKATHQVGDFPAAILVSRSEAAVLAEWQQIVGLVGVVTVGCAVAILAAVFAIGVRWRHQQSLVLERAERAEAEQARAEAEADLAREREQNAEEACRTKSGFLAMMSHEIRTPMNAVLGLAGTLLDSALPPPQRSMVSAIRDSGDSLLRLLNDILDFSKLDAGRMTFEDAPFSPAVVTHNTISILGPRATAKGLAIVSDADPTLPQALLGDAGRIRQVLLNLVSNAVKFTETGEVSIRASCIAKANDQATVEWTVHDTGIGIPEESIGNLFTEFVQADSSISRRFGGSGLGLAISKRLLDQMGGTVTVQSAPQQGTTFRVRLTLPVVETALVNNRPTRNETIRAFGARLQGLGRPLRVLFAEDNPTNQLVAMQLLKGFNVQVDVVADGLEAVDAAVSFVYDVICMDVRMPEMDGLAATRMIRKRGGQLATVPIIALTANAFPEDIQECLDAGMDQFVSKPVQKEALLHAMLDALADRTPQHGPAGDPNEADPGAASPAVPWIAGLPRSSGVMPQTAGQAPADASIAQNAIVPPQPDIAARPVLSGARSDGPLPMPGGDIEAIPASPPTTTQVAPGMPDLDHAALDQLASDIGDAGVTEMIGIFEVETTQRLERLAGQLDPKVLLREIHSLKGGAGTVCAGRLASRAGFIEARLRQGGALYDGDLAALTADFDAWREGARIWASASEEAA